MYSFRGTNGYAYLLFKVRPAYGMSKRGKKAPRTVFDNAGHLVDGFIFTERLLKRILPLQ